jgi:hypothetical protein
LKSIFEGGWGVPFEKQVKKLHPVLHPSPPLLRSDLHGRNFLNLTRLALKTHSKLTKSNITEFLLDVTDNLTFAVVAKE